ncbi:hypothetical protein GCM10007377_07890 [Galliscardovia ingluviei]|uniref:SpaA-like prealbumin fold domain-containing protein n=1 Tax=Galliscardovia ingluviei TaxID=1769422 RepID=A0A8J3AJB0_9BIFI|nr:SpaA isopeptide-forming pilin-related protein [Galliscardovia ingluviei]GGI13824.1 hypothetical protein GCM10007377_07890 [Galliscardovia ingluviei]
MQRLAKYGIAVIASIAVLAMAILPIITNVRTAYADTATQKLISSADLDKPVPLTVKAPVDSEQKPTEDLRGHTLVAFRLGDYTQVRTDGTNITGFDIKDAGYATQIDAAITAAKIDTSSTVPVAYKAADPMPWVVSHLLQASTYPYADNDAKNLPNLRAFLTALMTQMKGISAVDGTSYPLKANDDGSAATENVKPGAYVIFDQSEANTGDTASTDKASIPMFNGTGVYNDDTLLTKLVRPDPTDIAGTKTITYDLGEVVYKPTKVTITKTASTDNATIGEDITFTLTTQVPNWTGYATNYQLLIKDTLPAGMTYKANSATATVKATGASSATTLQAGAGKGYILVEPTASSNLLTWYMAPSTTATAAQPDSNIVQSDDDKQLFPVDATITITFSAYLDKDAVIDGTGNTNSAVVQYSHNVNNPADLEESSSSSVNVYTGQFTVTKTDIKGDKLNGAEFAVYAVDSDNTETKLTFVKSTTGAYRIADPTEIAADASKGVADKTTTQTLVTPATTGLLTITGLGEGTYKVTETKSPFGGGGLMLPTFTTTLTITTPEETAKDEQPLDAAQSSIADETGDINNFVTVAADNATVINAHNLLDMPKTGAAWLAIYAIAALVFAIGGVLLLVKSQRDRKTNKTK